VGSEPDYPPFCFVDEEGLPRGFSIDLFNAVTAAVDLDVRYQIGAWDKIKQDLAQGHIDALPLVGRTPEREALFDFTFPYLSLHGAVFVRDNTRDIDALSDLKDKTLVVMRGDNAEEFVRRKQLSEHIYTTNTYSEAFRKLASGEFDAVITQRILGITLLKELRIKNVVPLTLPLDEFRQDFCMAVQKGDSSLLARLNEGLSVVIANGSYETLHQKWFGPVYREKVSLRYLLKIVLLVLIPVLILGAFIWVFVLRSEVRRKTKGLQNEIEEHKKTVQILHSRQLMLSEMEQVSRIGGWEYDPTREKVNFTKGVYTVFDHVPQKNASQSSNDLFGLFYPDDREELVRAFHNTLKTGESFNLELRSTETEQGQKWIRISGRSEYRDGKVYRMYGNFLDSTDSVEARIKLTEMKNNLQKEVNIRTRELSEKVEKLNRSQKAMLYMVEDLNQMTTDLKKERQKLEAANKELETFTYSVSHDLKAPLRGIDGYSKLLGELYADQLNGEARQFIATIRNSTQHMNQLIDDLLQYSRLERSQLRFETVNLEKIIGSILTLNGDTIKQYRFSIKMEMNLPEIMTDPNGLMIALRNLIENALKFSKASPAPEIEIKGMENEETYIVSVTDNGVGFDMKYSQRIFEIFQRLHLPEEYPGTGIGLAMVAKAMQRLGGRVWTESSPGNGASFFLEIPKLNKI